MRWSWHSGSVTCFATLSRSFNGLEYKATIEEVGVLARFFTGWSRADLMGLSVRERRYWIQWATYVKAQAARTPDGV